MDFFKVANGSLLFVLVAAGIAYVMVQCVLFLRMALKRGRELGIDKKVISDTIKSSAVFTIAPSIAVALGLAAMAPSLGIPWPWFRLSVIGSVSYELMAANMASSALGFAKLGDAAAAGAEPFGAIMFAMTGGLAGAIILDIVFIKKVDSLAVKLKAKAGDFGTVAVGVLFFAVLAVFVVPFFGQGMVAVATFFTSIALTLILAVVAKRYRQAWLGNFILAFSLILSMCSAVLWTQLVK
ncbi:MAG TPA: DUF5058 family protein [Spirochaetia bacterium]|nr:DUF5058 family protein [Spirochaetaceae bacterium]HPE89972.1 DUF5058 family protein [Spirochaetales bacterium]HRW24719.1 DUF5058 family protein [Spirochaetia bacterium]